MRRTARRARIQWARRACARPDHVDEDDVHPRALSPPRRRRAGAAALGAALRRVTGAAPVHWYPKRIPAASGFCPRSEFHQAVIARAKLELVRCNKTGL